MMLKQSNHIFDLEQNILNAWRVLDDIDLAVSYLVDSPKFEHMPADVCDEIMNKFFGIKNTYELHFEKLWSTFEAHCKEHHSLRNSKLTYGVDNAEQD